ncbi:hypothetical protein N7508_008066 [Penicillium antarcticum]|uniref:uncharacterized protein n=1 Tax=Penicillium antarcticum TaxID=416450 RepID=UPI00238701FF|nr:uncharacterized protein N7508_008066 [Penicillium antarcticum]KAJ5297817.1 hypothetical protein N7508_008066 [Penicillium antarcticum]
MKSSSIAESSDELLHMTVCYFGNEFPNGGTKDVFRQLHNHSKNRHHLLLANFIEAATLVIREEVRSLPTKLRTLFPPFETVFGLADSDDLRSGPLGDCVNGMLICVVQLATLIGHYECSSGSSFNSQRIDLYTAGMGTGLLSAAAVSLSHTLGDLLFVGSEAVRIAFRLGILVKEVSQDLQPSTGGHNCDSWAYVVPGTSHDEVQNELDLIQEVETFATFNKVFISAWSRGSVTVSGPPARLKHMFLASDFLRDRKFIALPVYGGLCHAKHVYTKKHVNRIIQPKSIEQLDVRHMPRALVFSTNTGQPFQATNASEIFQNTVEELLTRTIHWDNVVQGIIDRGKDIGVTECVVLTPGSSLLARDLIEALNLESNGFKTSMIDTMKWISQSKPPLESARGTQQAKIAIVGMSCRMPGGANTTDKFWDVLNEGLDVHEKIPTDRFDVESHYDPTGKRVNSSHTPYGCFIDQPGQFDAPFFNISPREAMQTDPMQRLALVTAYEALERAGYVSNRTASTDLHRTGTFYGQASDDYREVNTSQEIGTYFITGGCRAFGPGRINYFFKFSGPSYSIDTACSSGLAAIHLACNSLWNGDTDMAVAGGMNVLTNSDAFAGLSNGHFLSKSPNSCKTWDCEADGYCRADGVASIVMKRLEDAQADNDNILGVILAAGTNHSAEAVSITHPHAGHQAYLTRQILSQAGVDPLDVSYVEMHGTGTQAGDAQEIQSVTDVFAPLTNAKRRSSKQSLHIGAVKANVGHGEAVAGTTALLKVLLMFDKEIIPPHVGIKNAINPAFSKDLKDRNIHIPYQRAPWSRKSDKKRVAVVNNFSAAGGNTSIVIEEPPESTTPCNRDPRSSHVIAVSAKSKISLKGNLQRLIAYVEANPNISLSNLAYTTTARRHHHNHRVAVSASDSRCLARQLRFTLQSTESHKAVPSTGQTPVIFAFTGQGASHRSSNLELFRDSPYFQSQFLHLDTICQAQGFPSIIPVIDGSFPESHSHSPTATQLALVCVEMTLTKYWESLGIKPDVVIGHSMGEYAALHAAGVVSVNDAIFLVGQRAEILEKRCQPGSHKMLAVRASLEEVVSKANGKPFEVACLNGPRDTVLSGTVGEIEALVAELENSGVKCFGLDVAFSFHSKQMDPILDELEAIARTRVIFHPPKLPIISPLLGKVIFDERTINANYICRATRETVNFMGAVETAIRIATVDETMAWVELGPHPVCVGLAQSIMSPIGAAVPSLHRSENNWQTLSQTLAVLHCAGVEVNWNEFHRPFEKDLRLLDLPTYAWNEQNHWIQYNGNWALTKGNNSHGLEIRTLPMTSLDTPARPTPISGLRTSLVHKVVDENFSGSTGRVVVQSDLMHSEFLAAAWGHKMNGAGVVTSSIYADIIWTLGKHLLEYLDPTAGKSVCDMEISNLVVREGLIAQTKTDTPQLIQISISTPDIRSRTAFIEMHNASDDGLSLLDNDPIVTAQIVYGNAKAWLTSWVPFNHFIQGRIETLLQLADKCVASRLSHNMVYALFADKLVDYADKYRGMRSVVLHGLEAFADVTIKATGTSGTWTVPPFFLDSVCHLAGFVMNVSDAMDTKNNFSVTPGWGSLRMARPLVAGAIYRSYVKMIPTAEDSSTYLGDVYVLQSDEIVGVMQAMKFRRYPRVLLNRFFSSPDTKSSSVSGADAPGTGKLAQLGRVPSSAPSTEKFNSNGGLQSPAEPPMKDTSMHAPAKCLSLQQNIVDTTKRCSESSIVNKAMALVAHEAAMEPSDLSDGATFASLGVDSLMSLVIAERLREELGVSVSGSLFLEYPTVKDFRTWLAEYYG